MALPRSRTPPGRGADARFEALLEGAPDSIVGVSRDGRIIFANHETERAFGYERGELIGRPVEVLLPERFRERHVGHREAYVQRPRRRPMGAGIDLVGRRKDGSEFPVEVSLSPVEGGDELQVVAIVREVTGRREAERRLRESERQLRLAQQVAHLGSWSYEPSCDQVYWSDELFRIYGFEPGDPRGGIQAAFDLIHAEDRGRVRESIHRALADRTTLSVEYRVHRPDGTVRVLDTRGEVVIDDDGSVRLVGTAQDITARRQAQRYLEEHTAFLQAVLGQAADAIVACDAEGRLVFVNTAARKMAQVFDPEVQLSAWGTAYDPDGTKVPLDEWPITKALAGERTLARELHMVREDGSSYDLLISTTPVRDAEGRIIGAVASAPDFTEYRRAERALRESERRLATLMSNLPGMVYRCVNDGQWSVEFVSEGAQALLGVAPAEAIGKPGGFFNERIVDEDRPKVRREVMAAVAEDRSYQITYRTRTLDGVEKSLWEQGRAVTENGKVIAVEGFITDVTDRERALEELARARDEALAASRLKSVFLSTISHEIRTPLNVILGFTHLIADELREGDDNRREMLDGIERAGKRLITTVHQVLDYSRIETGDYPLDPVELDLETLLRPVLAECRLAADKKGLAFSWESDAPGAAIVFDAQCFTGAVRSVLDNAVKFTFRGRVEAALRRDADGALCFEVRDTGVGIGEEYLPRLFEPFNQEMTGYTRPFEGAGIGLALAKRYLELGGAGIAVESRKGEGSAFTIRFPREVETRATDAAPTVEAPAAIARQNGRRPVVLVVEDDGQTQGLMKEILRARCDVIVASTGRKARRHLSARPGRIDAILMDVSLKGDEDGLALTRWLREQAEWRDVMVIATTAHASPEDRRQALEAGCSEFLPKPFRFQDLLALIDRIG